MKKWQQVVGIELLAVAVVLTVVFFLKPSEQNRKIVCSNVLFDIVASSELQEVQEDDNSEQVEEPIIKEICVPEPEDVQNDSKVKLQTGKQLTKKIDANVLDTSKDNVLLSNDGTSNDATSDNSKPSGPIDIDTSQWRFNKIDVAYDGKEHVAEVSGLPSWVTPVYKDNKRTEVGSNKAYVSFIVPEGYNKPADMVTDITIRKGKYDIALSEDDIQMLGNGKFRIVIAEDKIPEGVEVSYLLNGSEVNKDYVLSGPGQYIITAKFTHSNPNYEPIEDSEVLYVKKEEITKSQPYELILKQVASEKENEIKVELYLNCIYSSANGFQATIKYDNYLKYQGMELNLEQWEYYSFKEDTGYIYIAPDFAHGMSLIGTITFTMSEEEKIGTIEFSNIMVIDRGWGMHNIDPVKGVLSKIPQYEITESSLNTILNDVEIESFSYVTLVVKAEEIDVSEGEVQASDISESEMKETDVSEDKMEELEEEEDKQEENEETEEKVE